MRLRAPLSFVLVSLLSDGAWSSGFDCERIVADGYKYDLSPLKGVHTLYHVDRTEEAIVNTTYVLNICNSLQKAATRGDLKCGTSKRICGFRYKTALDGSGDSSFPFPIAGLDHAGGGSMDPKITRLKNLDPGSDGLLLKLSGGSFPGADKSQKLKASAVIEFQCDPDRTGLEGLGTRDDDAVADTDAATEATVWAPLRSRTTIRVAADGDSDGGSESGGDDEEGSDSSRSLQFKSFGAVDDKSYILKLNWRTRYACDNYLNDRDDKKENKPSSSSHWGFFTWLIIILFLCVAAYLIFGSWLNYNRYGARGWDLLPHGDTLRDVPYIFQDWLRRVLNTLQGPGARGGYSSV